MISQGARETIQLGDFVVFERVGADREWRNTLAKVIGFPTPTRLRVELFERADTAPRSTAWMDEKLREIATRTGKEDHWEAKQVLEQETRQLTAEEDRALAELFRLRAITQERQSGVLTRTREAMGALDRAREAIARLPQRQWRDLRAPGHPTEALMSLCRAIMLTLQENRATSWDAMQSVMQQPGFMDRIMQLDCSVTPLPKARRQKICMELGIPRRSLPFDGAGDNSKSGKQQRRPSAAQGTQLEIAMRNWLSAQIACSEAREVGEQLVEDCFPEQQEQASLMRQVNNLRLKISTLLQEITERKLAICDGTPLAVSLLEDESATSDSIFYRSTSNGRPVVEVILRDSVLSVLGAKAEEREQETETEETETETECGGGRGGVYVRLTPEEIADLRTVSRAANDVHDVEELETLHAADEHEEQQMRELRARMEELRQRDEFLEEDEEEMRQLDAQLTDAVRRHETTQWRIRSLGALGRDKLFLEGRRLKGGIVESDLHLMFSGDTWDSLVADTVHRENLEGALSRDLQNALGLPAENIGNIRFTRGSPLVEFTVRHSSDVAAEQLQALANEADYPEFRNYYERITSKQTYPLNTPLQVRAYEDAMYLERLQANFSGAGLPEKLEDFVDDGEESASDDEDHRHSIVRIATTRNDYGLDCRCGYPILARENCPAGVSMMV